MDQVRRGTRPTRDGTQAVRSKLGRPSSVVIPPFLMGSSRRIQAAVFSFMAGVMPPMPMLGRSLL
jgi:hypothetical protein